ncbi:substrate-binding domain-containing protein [Paraburkholderia silviterrae]|uniref:ABC transporter substrate-binding protein n=1 Tax=Paraburkholderia silviterrae TaxID=2528715 RepID=A0A4R5M2W9_9BURK|nr:substrate-binding domain-containing protein [Paraburkholderia silviterrae]TDG19948.1 ABC transporter substrate-binding protein [Paraburkholderia silviterrae]
MDVQHIDGDAITGISSMATRHVLTALAGAYERQSGRRVRIESTGGVDAARRVLAGESFDFVVLASQAIEDLAAAGRIDPGSRVDIARSRMAIAVRAGEPLPEAGTETALRDALLAARSIGYSTGPSGSHLLSLFERWGVAERVAPRIVQAPPGVPVGTLVARGEVELGVQQMSELIDLPGIDVTDALPPEIEATTLFSAAVCMPCRRHEATRALLAFLVSPEAGPAKLRHGMEPA